MVSPQNKGKKRATILVVDDTPENLVFVSEMLKDDYEVKAATNGQTALAIVEKFAIDLILLDVVMPGMDGYEVCRQIKAKKTGQDIPVIFLTSKSKGEDQEFGFSVAPPITSKSLSATDHHGANPYSPRKQSSKDFLHDQNAFLEAGSTAQAQRAERHPGCHH